MSRRIQKKGYKSKNQKKQILVTVKIIKKYSCSEQTHKSSNTKKPNVLTLVVLAFFIYLVCRDAGIIEAIKNKWNNLEPVAFSVDMIFRILSIILLVKLSNNSQN